MPHCCIKTTPTKFIYHLVAKSNGFTLVLTIPDCLSLAFLLKLQSHLPKSFLAFISSARASILYGVCLKYSCVHSKPSFLGELTCSHGFNCHPVLDTPGNQVWVHTPSSITLFTTDNFCMKSGEYKIPQQHSSLRLTVLTLCQVLF